MAFARNVCLRFDLPSTPLAQIHPNSAIIVRLGGLTVFFYTIFVRRSSFMVRFTQLQELDPLHSYTFPLPHSFEPCLQCWETYIGQMVYTLMMVTFGVEIMTSLFYDPTQKWAYERYEWTHKV